MTRSEGVDVSAWQVAVDWPRVRADGITWAYVRLLEGTTSVDARYAQHVAGARAAGLRVGGYCYHHPGGTVRSSAEAYLRLAEPLALELPHCLDVETWCGPASGPSHACRAHPAVSGERVVDSVEEWCSVVEAATGRPVMVYIGPAFVAAVGGWERVAHRPLWVAAYHSRPTQPAPAPWSEWAAWQWTDGGATGPRVLTAGLALDRNRSTLSAEELAALGCAPNVVRPVDVVASLPLAADARRSIDAALAERDRRLRDDE